MAKRHLTQYDSEGRKIQIYLEANEVDVNGRPLDEVIGEGVYDPQYVHTDNNYTTAEKNKLTGLRNYDDTDVQTAIRNINDAIDRLTGTSDTTEIIDTMNEVIDFLSGLDNTDNLANELVSIRQQLANKLNAGDAYNKHEVNDLLDAKQDIINDLVTIRNGARLGSTAVQTETDPTVPSWAKQPRKPTYTAAEVGALPANTTIPQGTVTAVKVNDGQPVYPNASGVVSLTISASGAQVQPNWNETNTESPAYIQNKPDVANAISVNQHSYVMNNNHAFVIPDYYTKDEIDELIPEGGKDGITPHIDVVTGHWFIGDEDTGIDAHGLQGNSGYTGAVGELEVVEDYTEGGVGKAASAEAVKNMAIKSIPGAGTFADAYEKARANNVVFPWFLRDVDENGNPIEKMIWHNGYRKFVDAIGAEVEGQKNGLTIKVSEGCYLQVGDNPLYALSKGSNNFSFDDLNWNGSSAINYSKFKVLEYDETTANANYSEEIDFGGLKIRINDNFLSNWDSLKKVKRLHVELYLISHGLLAECDELIEAQIKGTMATGITGVSTTTMLNKCPKLERADLKEYSVAISPQGQREANFYGIATSCPRLKYADIRGFDTEQAVIFGNVFRYDSSLKTLVIGNLSNANITTKAATCFEGVTDCVLICTTAVPPVLKNCSLVDNVAQDEYDPALDWVAGHFSAIYVPTNAVTVYKTNTYVEGGTVGNTGWSKYADIIHDIAGTEYEDII